MTKIDLINKVIKNYFEHFKSEIEVQAMDLMPYFIKEGVFSKDEVSGLPIRRILRDLDKKKELDKIPYLYADRKHKNTNWYFRRINPTTNLGVPKKESRATFASPTAKVKSRKDNDEHYVLDLCDEILQLKGSRQHTFDFLIGDSGRKLPLDAYYSKIDLVIEYRETQHTNQVKFFDKPDIMTVSGVSRGEQRRIYDQRRRDVLPKNGIKLVEINYLDFECDIKHRIIRNKERDLEVVRGILKIIEQK